MTKNFLISGVNWVAEVEVNNAETYEERDLHIETTTRAVEAKFGKRKDVNILYHDPLKITPSDEQSLETHLLNLLTHEITPKSGIGMVMCIMDLQTSDDKENEWYISSKVILENAGFPSLVEKFDHKFPDKKSKTR
jgi:hypothetical protein